MCSISSQFSWGHSLRCGGKIECSVGQVAYSTISGEQGSVTEGVVQPYEYSILTETPIGKYVQLSIYPNPTNDQLHLKVNVDKVAGIRF